MAIVDLRQETPTVGDNDAVFALNSFVRNGFGEVHGQEY